MYVDMGGAEGCGDVRSRSKISNKTIREKRGGERERERKKERKKEREGERKKERKRGRKQLY